MSGESELIERLRALHTPRYKVGDKWYTQRVAILEEDMTPDLRLRHQCVSEADVEGTFDEACSPDEGHQVEACGECRTSTPDYEIAYFTFPCPTIRLVNEFTAPPVSSVLPVGGLKL